MCAAGLPSSRPRRSTRCFYEGRQVVATLAQRWKRDREDVETIEEIAPEPAAPDIVGQVAIGRGDDPDIHSRRAVGAEAFDLSLLQHAQDLWLELEGQVTNLVEEDNAAIRELEPAGLCGVRSCECARSRPARFR